MGCDESTAFGFLGSAFDETTASLTSARAAIRKVQEGSSVPREVSIDVADDKVAAEEEEVAGLSSMTVVELRELLKENGLKVSGNKDELIERLTDSA